MIDGKRNNATRRMHGRDLTTGSIPQHLLAFSWPILIGNFLQTSYGIINAMWVGNGLGVNAMAAVTVSMPIFSILIAIAMGFSTAVGILAAQSYGAKDYIRLRVVVHNSIILTAIISTICMLVGYFGASPIAISVRTDPRVLPMTASYLKVLIWSIPFMFGMFLTASLLRGTGDSTTPLIFQGISLVINAVLDPIFMFGWLGFPKCGLNGTAYASIVSQVFALVALIIYIVKNDYIISPKLRFLKFDVHISAATLKLGVPTMIQQALISLGALIIVGIVNDFGKTAAAAYGVAARIDQLAFMPSIAIGIASTTLTGQNIGARLFDRVRETFKWSMIIGCGITALISATAFLFPNWIMHWFIKDSAVVEIGAGYLRIVGTAYVLFAVMIISNGIINGSGHTLIPTICTLINVWLVRVPAAEFMSSKIGTVNGVWYGFVFGFSAGAIISLSYYISGRWKKPAVTSSKTATKPDTA